jgi:nucleotide-binding universal stress UspA family protein
VQKRILLAVDDSKAAHRALQYVGEITGGRAGFHVDLYHRLPALPPELREHGGSEYPDRETELGRQLSQRIAQWVASLKADLEPTLERCKQQLADCGLAPGAVRFCIDEEVYPGETLADALRRVAQERHCGTIAVAREHVPIVYGIEGLDGIYPHHTGDELVREGAGFTVWVIG